VSFLAPDVVPPVPSADDVPWRQDLARSLAYEQHVAGLLKKREASNTFASNSNSTYDLKDLISGEKYENEFDDKQPCTFN
jgi:hypothetical protein